MLNFTAELISTGPSLNATLNRINAASVLAVDIETINWWNREAERIALVQLAFWESDKPTVMIIDALAGFDLEPLRQPLELSLKVKAIHNASFDAVKLARHFRIITSPIHDTMLAARRCGERHCSLRSQVETHLGFQLDKSEQRGDWSRRPLSEEQLNYASLDAACTLLLYEKQVERGLRGDYELRDRGKKQQESLPLLQREIPPLIIKPAATGASTTEPEQTDKTSLTESGISRPALALLGIVVELNGRYSPQQLAVSVNSERIGLAGWIIDRLLGIDADLDEDSVKQEIATLCDQGLIHLSLSRRLEATTSGSQLWRENKKVLNLGS